MSGYGYGDERNDPNDVWQDREIRFDVSADELEPRKGEYAIDHMNQVEDTKGNNGERGELRITNLRLVWWSSRKARTNLSIGYSSVISINIRQAQSRLRGATHALYVLTRFNVRLLVPALAPVCEGEPVSPRTCATATRASARARPRTLMHTARASLADWRTACVRTALWLRHAHTRCTRTCLRAGLSLRVCLHEPREELAAALHDGASCLQGVRYHAPLQKPQGE